MLLSSLPYFPHKSFIYSFRFIHFDENCIIKDINYIESKASVENWEIIIPKASKNSIERQISYFILLPAILARNVLKFLIHLN